MARAIRLVFLIGAALVPQFATAAQPAEAAPRKSQAPATSSPLRFRRIYAPAERVQDWPRGTARYVPVEGEEFERLLKAAQEQGSEGPAPASLSRVAEYTAQFGERRESCKDHSLRKSRSGSGNASARGSLGTVEPGARRHLVGAIRHDPVELGLDPNGRPVLIAHRSRRHGNWHLVSARSRRDDSDGQLAFFDLELPTRAGTTLLLTAAARYRAHGLPPASRRSSKNKRNVMSTESCSAERAK